MAQDFWAGLYGSNAPNQPADFWADLYGVTPVSPEEASTGPLTPIKTAVGSAMEFVNRPSRAVAEAALAAQKGEALLPGVQRALSGDSNVSFEDVLAQAGMDEGMGRTLAGLGLDIVTDPLNLVGGLPMKAVAAIDKLPAIQKAARSVKSLPIVEDLGKKFVPHYNLPDAYTAQRRLLDSEVAFRKAEAFGRAQKRYSDVSPEEAKRITLALDKPDARLGDPKLDPLLDAQRSEFADQASREVAAGVLPADKLKEDYVTYLFGGPLGDATRAPLSRTLSARNPFAKTRDLVSIEQALYLGAEPHIARIAAVRGATGDRAIAVANFFKRTADEFGIPEAAAPTGFRPVHIAADIPIKEVFKGKVFDPAVADDLEKLFTPGTARGAIDNAFRIATGVWKGYATATNPGFHVRNLASNIFNSWLGGMSLAKAPLRYAEAAAPLRNIGPHSAAAIDDAMKRYGVVGSGHGAFGEVASELDRLVAGTRGSAASAAQAINPLSRFNLLQRGGREAGQLVEDWSRRALFLDQLHHGKSLEEAALHVKKYLFDYAELTDFERGIRDYAVPFYTWLRKNFPLQVENFLTQPHKYAHVGKIASEIEEAGGSVPSEERPKWMQQSNLLQLPFNTTADESVFLNPDLPYQDLNLLPTDAISKGEPIQAGSDFFASLLASANPWIKIPTELALNREAYTGREIMDPTVGGAQTTRAPAYLSAIADLLPATASQMGMAPAISRQGEEQWTMPVRGAYLANQVPFLTKLGKTVSTTEADQQGKLGRFQPRQLSYLGFGVYPLSEEARARNLVNALRDQATRGRRLNRQDALTLPADPSELEALLLRLALGGSQ